MEDTFEITNSIIRFQTILKNNSDASKTEKVKSYLKSPYKFYGVSVPFTDKIAKEFIKENKNLHVPELIELIKQLWGSSYHEEKTLSLKLLRIIDIQDMGLLEELLEESKGWDHVDEISIHLVGSLIMKNNEYLNYLRKWSVLDNFWMRRASLISQILPFRHGLGDRLLFYALASQMIEEKEFFIRKAIGWTLRELSKSYPDEVFDYLIKVKDKASGLTLREGSKRLPQKYQTILLAKQ
jgi:3-methyladenine DNA glycosylase AlkD